MPDWNRFWDDLIQEELRDEDLYKKKTTFGDDMALAVRIKGKQKKDLHKLNCFSCGEYGHYSTKCLKKKKREMKRRRRRG